MIRLVLAYAAVAAAAVLVPSVVAAAAVVKTVRGAEEPPMIKLSRVDRWYDITHQLDLPAGRTRITPREAHVIHYGPKVITGPGEARVSVYVNGPISRLDGTPSSRSSKVIYGRFGLPLDQAPAWVREIAATEEVL